jgi:hypothetical protein
MQLCSSTGAYMAVSRGAVCCMEVGVCCMEVVHFITGTAGEYYTPVSYVSTLMVLIGWYNRAIIYIYIIRGLEGP